MIQNIISDGCLGVVSRPKSSIDAFLSLVVGGLILALTVVWSTVLNPNDTSVLIVTISVVTGDYRDGMNIETAVI